MRVLTKRNIFNHWWFLVPGFFLGLLLAFFYNKIYNALNPDMIAYFSVARHYQELNFIRAFNSYWSPLICWLLALFPNLKTEPMTAYRWINIAAAFAIYHQLYFWIRLVLSENINRFLFSSLAALFLTYQALYIGSPDFISIFPFLLFLKMLIRYKATVKDSVLLALTIVLCFFSKTFLLMLCISVVGCFFLFQLFQTRRMPAIRPLIVLCIVTGSILFLWASCLRLHYGFYTLSSVLAYNTSAPSTERPHLMPPENEYALFIWEDPYYIKIQSEYSGDLNDKFQKLKQRWEYNWNVTVYYFRYFSWFRFGIFLIPLVGYFYNRSRRNRISLLLLTVFILNLGGYFSIVLQERYLVIGQILLYLSVFGFSERLLENVFRRQKINFAGKKVIKTLGMLFIFSGTAKSPLIEAMREWKNYPVAHQQILQVYELANTGILKDRSIATYKDSELLYDYLSLACFLGEGHYYGEIDTEKSADEQQKEIEEHKLDLLVTMKCNGKSYCKNKEWLTKLPVVYDRGDGLMVVKVGRQ